MVDNKMVWSQFRCKKYIFFVYLEKLLLKILDIKKNVDFKCLSRKVCVSGKVIAPMHIFASLNNG